MGAHRCSVSVRDSTSEAMVRQAWYATPGQLWLGKNMSKPMRQRWPCIGRSGREFFFCIFQKARPEWHEDSAADLRSAPEAHVVQSGPSALLPVHQRLCEMNTHVTTGASAGSRSEFVR